MFHYNQEEPPTGNYWWKCLELSKVYFTKHRYSNDLDGVIVRVYDKEYDLGKWFVNQQKCFDRLSHEQRMEIELLEKRKGFVSDKQIQSLVEVPSLPCEDQHLTECASVQPTNAMSPEEMKSNDSVLKVFPCKPLTSSLSTMNERPLTRSHEVKIPVRIVPASATKSAFVAFAYRPHAAAGYEVIEVGYGFVKYSKVMRENVKMDLSYLMVPDVCSIPALFTDELDCLFYEGYRYTSQDQKVSIEEKAVLAFLEFQPYAIGSSADTKEYYQLSERSKVTLRNNKAFQVIRRIKEALTDNEDVHSHDSDSTSSNSMSL